MYFFFNKNKPPASIHCTCGETKRIYKSERKPMKFPYTFTAKLVQFPFRHYVKHNWIWRYYIFGLALSTPVFWYINGLANSPENVAKWAEIKCKEQQEWESKFE
ncbi:unnamed protein product [Psylliodes chrysocephalus]|uniref:Uncharacterized protein n=1 Tax=Psylliodes chrysocephalus TaxID=3402493 RepID=A0A9P0D6I2_9CUCU|nr:unnamed protein product [Psylliodes chrysocephala]